MMRNDVMRNGMMRNGMMRNGVKPRAGRSFAAAALCASVCVATPLAAQRTQVLVVAGLSGEPAFKNTFDATTNAIVAAARTRWKLADSSIIVLTEDSVVAGRPRARSTRASVAAAFASLSRRVQPGDLLLVVLIGHGSGEGDGSKVNLPGPDATATDYASWISGFARQTVVFVNTASGSGDFVPVLAGPGRIVVASTRSAMERNESIFGPIFARALDGDESDGDKDGRVSVLEAYRYTTREVARAYEAGKKLQTEHAQLSDSLLARSVAFGGAATTSDPRIAALVAERQTLEADVAALRAKKTSLAAAAYDAELERLLLAIAEKTQAIKAAGGGK